MGVKIGSRMEDTHNCDSTIIVQIEYQVASAG